jgi:hypothetical protein
MTSEQETRDHDPDCPHCQDEQQAMRPPAKMRLADLLAETGDDCQLLPEGCRRVFHRGCSADPRYWDLEDFGVAANLSGPSIRLYSKAMEALEASLAEDPETDFPEDWERST